MMLVPNLILKRMTQDVRRTTAIKHTLNVGDDMESETGRYQV